MDNFHSGVLANNADRVSPNKLQRISNTSLKNGKLSMKLFDQLSNSLLLKLSVLDCDITWSDYQQTEASEQIRWSWIDVTCGRRSNDKAKCTSRLVADRKPLPRETSTAQPLTTAELLPGTRASGVEMRGHHVNQSSKTFSFRSIFLGGVACRCRGDFLANRIRLEEWPRSNRIISFLLKEYPSLLVVCSVDFENGCKLSQWAVERANLDLRAQPAGLSKY